MKSIQNKNYSGKDKEGDISFDSIGEGGAQHTSILILLLFVLSSFSAFALGRLSLRDTEKQRGVVVETIPRNFFEAQTEASGSSPDGSEKSQSSQKTQFLVGSKNSTKYHFPWCSGAKRIKPENLVSFSTYEEARNAGYTPASNCDGLQ